MAPSGNAIPQRFRSRPSPTPLSAKETTEMNGKWDELLDRRQRCKERYRNIKKELENATDALTQIDKKKEEKLQNSVIKLDAFSFIPTVSKNDRFSRNEMGKSSRNIERNSNFVESITSKVSEDFGSRKSSSRFSDRSSRESSMNFEISRNSRGREPSSDRIQFGSRFTESRSARAREPSSDRVQYGSRFTDNASRFANQSSRFREQSSDRYVARSSKPRESPSSKDLPKTSVNLEKRSSSDSYKSSKHNEPVSITRSSNFNSQTLTSSDVKSPDRASLSEGSRSLMSFPMHSLEEAAKNANNSRTLVDKVERNADVPKGKTSVLGVSNIHTNS